MAAIFLPFIEVEDTYSVYIIWFHEMRGQQWKQFMRQWAVRMWLLVRPISFGNNKAQSPHVDKHERRSINYLHIALKYNLSVLNEMVCCYSDRTRFVFMVSTVSTTNTESCS